MAAKRTATVLKILHGTDRADRARNEVAVRPPGVIELDPIFDLEGEEVAMFRWITDNMTLPMIHARGDGIMLARLAKQMVALRKAEAKLREFGAVMKNPSTQRPELQPYYYAVNQLNDSVRKLANDLGLTPTSRLRFAPPTGARDGAPTSWDAID